MHKTNFRIPESIYLEHDGMRFDLHHDYEFDGFRYDVVPAIFCMTWRRSQEGWAPSHYPARFDLYFQGVRYLAVKAREPEVPFEEDVTLEFMGYVHPDFLGRTDTYLSAELAQDDYHMIFAFQGGQVVVILADEITLNVTAT